MSKKLISALLLIAITVIVLLLNRGSVGINFIIADVSMQKALAFLMFTAIGVAIGVLLK